MRVPKCVCICGGGSIAHVFAGVIGSRGDVEVRLLTRRPDDWSCQIDVLYQDDLQLTGKIHKISSEPDAVLPGAEVVFVTVPCFARASVLTRLRPWLDRRAWIGAMPAWGGFEWEARAALGAGYRLFGSQRIPFVCHKLEYGRSVAVTGIRPQTFIASMPTEQVGAVSSVLGELLRIRVVPMPNFLSVALTPTNPVMNPARLYALFRDWSPGRIYDRRGGFYRDWDEASTRVFGRCDAEVQDICRAIPLDLAYVKPIVQHYEVARLADVTRTVRRLRPLRARKQPLRTTPRGFELDTTSSHFTEDIPYGLVVIRSIAEVVKVPTPTIDAIIEWAERVTDKHYLVEGQLRGRDVADLPIALNHRIRNIDDLIASTH